MIVVAMAAACSPAGTDSADTEGSDAASIGTDSTTTPNAASESVTGTPDQDSEAPEQLGPNGERPVRQDDVQLSNDDLDAVREMDADVAFVWQVTNNFSESLERGAEARFRDMNVEIVARTDAGFDPSKQASDLESVIALNPDVIISTPVDAATSEASYRAALDAGIKLVFIEQPPEGFQHGEDYVGIVGADYVTAARHSAALIGDAMGNSGKLGFFFYDANFFVTNQWDDAFRNAVEESYPDIEIIDAGFADPARADQTASAVFTQHSDISGVYATWQDPLEGVLAALRQSSVDQSIPATTIGLNENVALAIAQEENVVGVGVDAPFDQGGLVADIAALGLLERQAPPFTVVDANKITRSTLADGWEASYGVPLPSSVTEVLEADPR